MEKVIQRSISLIIALLLMFTAVGCTSTENEQSDGQNVSTEQSTEQSTVSGTTSTSDEKITITMLTFDYKNAPLSNDVPVMQELSKQTNVDVEYQLVPNSDLKQKVETSIAAKQLPDIICSGGDILSKYTSSGVFAKLNDFYSSSNSFKNLFAKYPTLEKNIKDDNGDFFLIPQLTERLFYCHEMINQDLLDKAGVKAPTNLTELEAVLKAFKALGDDVIPYELSPWMGYNFQAPILHAFDVNAPIGNDTSAGFSGWFDFTGTKYEFGPYDRKDNYKQYLEYMNKLWKEGLIDSNAYAISDDDIIAKLQTNKVGFMYGWGDGFSLWGKGGSYGTNFVPMAALQGPDGKSHSYTAPYIAGNNFYISSSSTYVERIEKWIDYIYGDEGIKLLNWGVEGVTYTEANGQKQYVDDITKDPKVIGVNKRRVYGISPPAFPHFFTNDAESQVVGDLTAQYTELCKDNAYPTQPLITGTADEETEYSNIMNDINKYVKEQSAAFITGKVEITDNSFNKFIAQLEKMGIKRASEIQNAKYTRWSSR